MKKSLLVFILLLPFHFLLTLNCEAQTYCQFNVNSGWGLTINHVKLEGENPNKMIDRDSEEPVDDYCNTDNVVRPIQNFTATDTAIIKAGRTYTL